MANQETFGGRVRVFARIRPAVAEDGVIAVQVAEEARAVRVAAVAPGINLDARGSETEAHEFVFDRAFPVRAAQEDLFLEIGIPILRECIKGFNGTIFAYGQTGSGKTHSLLHRGKTVEESGLLPRLVASLFSPQQDEKKTQQAPLGVLEVEVAALQVYNEQVDDLLHADYASGGGHGLAVQNGGAVAGLTWIKCKRAEKALKHLYRARGNLIYAETKMNKASSRSHAIFQMRITRRGIDGMVQAGCVECTTARLCVVDLAGSERVKKSGAEGAQFKEAAAINTSLLALGNVVSALVAKKTYIPFRDSKLTRLLEGSLGGNCKTVLLVCASPSIDHAQETICSFEFASRAMRVEQNARANVCLVSLQTEDIVADLSEIMTRGAANALHDEIRAGNTRAQEAEARIATAEEAMEAAFLEANEAKARAHDLELALRATREAAEKNKFLAARALVRHNEVVKHTEEREIALKEELPYYKIALQSSACELEEEIVLVKQLRLELTECQPRLPSSDVKNRGLEEAIRSELLEEQAVVAALLSSQISREALLEDKQKLQDKVASLSRQHRALEEDQARLDLARINAANSNVDLKVQNESLQHQVEELRQRCKMEQSRRIALVEGHEEDRQKFLKLQACVDEQRKQLCAKIRETEVLRSRLVTNNYVVTRNVCLRGAEIASKSTAEVQTPSGTNSLTRSTSATSLIPRATSAERGRTVLRSVGCRLASESRTPSDSGLSPNSPAHQEGTLLTPPHREITLKLDCNLKPPKPPIADLERQRSARRRAVSDSLMAGSPRA